MRGCWSWAPDDRAGSLPVPNLILSSLQSRAMAAERVDNVGRKNTCAPQGQKRYQDIHEAHPRVRGGRLLETKRQTPT